MSRRDRRVDIDDDDLADFIDWGVDAFGPATGQTAAGVVDHIKKELVEIEAKPDDLEEWIDVMMLAVSGAARSAGASPLQIIRAWHAKFEKNLNREWPDWRTAEPGKAIEHIR